MCQKWASYNLSEFDLIALERSHLAFLERFRRAAIGPQSHPVTLLQIRLRVFNVRRAVVSGIFFAVERCQMRRIFIEIRSPDSELLSVCIDPFPEVLT
jgi:hypothetical protein